MKLEKALHIIDIFVQHGWDIDFEIVDQSIFNGDTKASPRYTYTSYIYSPDPSHMETDYIEEYKKTYDSLASMYIDIASKLEKRILGDKDKKECRLHTVNVFFYQYINTDRYIEYINSERIIHI